MEDETVYPELLDYLFEYGGKYFWENEIKVNRHLQALAKCDHGVNTAMYKIYVKRGNISQDQQILDLASGGFEAFKTKVATRIFNKHRHKMELNLCPACGKIARTPWAKQCRFCFYDWH